MASTAQGKGEITVTASLERSRFGGTPEPRITIRSAGRDADRRAVAAAAYRMAALLEEASAGERWIVVAESVGQASGDVHLELAEGDEAEAARGLAVVQRVAAAFHG